MPQSPVFEPDFSIAGNKRRDCPIASSEDMGVASTAVEAIALGVGDAFQELKYLLGQNIYKHSFRFLILATTGDATAFAL